MINRESALLFGGNGGSIFLDIVNPLMHFRIGTMSGKISRNGIDFLAQLIPYSINLLIEIIFNALNLLIEIIPKAVYLLIEIIFNALNLLIEIIPNTVNLLIEFIFNTIDLSIEIIFNAIDLLIEIIPNTVNLLIERFDFEIHEFDLFRQLLPCVPDLFAKRLMAFSDNVQFVLEMFGLDSNLMAKLGFDFLLEVTDDLFEAFEIFTIHYGYPLSQLNGRYP